MSPIRYDPSKPLTQSELRSYVEEFDTLRVALRETHVADPLTMLHVRVDFDGAVITHAMGSVDLVLAAVSEAFRYIAPLLTRQSSFVQVQVGNAGRRWDGKPYR